MGAVTFPRFVRDNDCNFEPIQNIIFKCICEDKELPGWMNGITWTSEIIRPLVELTKGNLVKILEFFGRSRFSLQMSSSTFKPLHVNDIRRIIKIVKNSDDPIIIRGAAVALIRSNFVNVASFDVILKLLNIYPQSALIFDLSSGLSLKIYRAAEYVMQNPRDFSLKVQNAATSYLGNNSSYNLTPLINLETELEIIVQQSYGE
jgi:hypothetical protein